MTWKYRQGDSWTTPTIKHRKDNQWVEISGSSDDGSGTTVPDTRFYNDQQGPPNRDGAIIIYPSDGYSSLQAAYNDLMSDDTLIIESGSYTETLDLLDNPVNSITLQGESDATLVIPSGSSSEGIYADNGSPNYPTDATLVGSHDGHSDWDSPGDDWITVSTTDPFNVGDDIHIFEDRHAFGFPDRPGANDKAREFRMVTEVDESESRLRINYPLFLYYPNNNTTAVGVMDWYQEDVYITNLDVDANGTDEQNVYFKGVKEYWIEDMEVSNSGSDQHRAFLVSDAYRMRADNIDGVDLDRYMIWNGNWSTSCLYTNITGHSIGRYCVRAGNGAIDTYKQNMYAMDGTRAGGTHYGGWWTQVDDTTVENSATKMYVLRTHHVHIDGGTEDGGLSESFVLQQYPDSVLVENIDIINKADHYVFGLYCNNGDTYATDVTFRNFNIEAYNNSKTSKSGAEQIGQFDSSTFECQGELRFENVYYAGTKLTESDVQNWDGFSSGAIENLVVK